MQNERVLKVDQKYITLTRLIFAEINFCEIDFRTYFHGCQNQFFAWIYFRRWSNFNNFAWINFRGRQKFVFEKIAFSYLCLNKQKKLKDLDIKIVYIISQCIYNKYYACDFRRSLLLLANHYHYFHHLNVQKCWKFYWARK